MRITEATDEQKIKALAELDGRKLTTECDDCYGTGFGGSEMDHIPCDTCHATGKVKPHYSDTPDYLTSYDAIIPLVQKQPVEIRIQMFHDDVLWTAATGIMKTPTQLCDALLVATGKFEL